MMNAVSLTSDALMAASAARTGLDDFGLSEVGGDGFREGLDRLLADIRKLDLSTDYQEATAWQLGSFLDARARAVHGLKGLAGGPRPIRQPLIIAGLVRSGTTALHQLLSMDPQFQGPEHWLTMVPMPRPARDDWDQVPEYRAIAERMAAYVAAAPEMADDHMMSAEGVEESLFILAQSFASNMFPSMWQVPDYDRWYQSRPDTDSYRWLARVLGLIGANDDRRWLLKNPTDLFSLAEVLEVFPDALVVQTHRDPVAAIPSIASLIHASRRVFSGDRADPTEVGQREALFWRDALEKAHAVRSTSKARFVDVEFSHFVTDQMATVRNIYDSFGLELTAETEAAMQGWLDAHPRRTGGSGPRYRAADFGLTEDGLRAVYADYRARRGYA